MLVPMMNLIAFSLIVSIQQKAVQYLDHAQYREAATLCRETLARVEPDSLEAALMLDDLTRAYRGEGYLLRAQATQQQVLKILRSRLGEEDANVAVALDGLGEIYFEQRRFTEARNAFRQALHIAEKTLDPSSIHLATILNDLGAAYYFEGRTSEAEKLLQRSLAIRDSLAARANLKELAARGRAPRKDAHGSVDTDINPRE